MSLVFVTLLWIVGLYSTYREIYSNKSSKLLVLLFCCLFVYCCYLRVGRSYAYSDLTAYIMFYIHNSDAYFESGYILFTNIIECIFGRTEHGLVLGSSISVLLLFIAAIKVAMNDYTTVSLKKSFLTFSKIKDNKKFHVYYSSLLLCFCMYLGFGCAAENIRPGIARCLLLLSYACMLQQWRIPSLSIFFVAATIHQSSFLFLPGLLIAGLKKWEFRRNQYIVWFGFIIVIDLFLQITNSAITPMFYARLVSILTNSFSFLSFLTRFYEYNYSYTVGSYFSTQYITYHFIGLLMIFGDLNNKNYNKCVFMYFIGMSLGTLFQGVINVTRISLLYYSIIPFVFLFFLKDNNVVSRNKKFLIVSMYSLLQMIMVLRWLGFYFI